MPSVRRYIDPDTLDYVIENGEFKKDETHIATVIRLLTLRRGTCIVAPELGNRLFNELENLGNDAKRRAENYCREALEPLTKRRLITELFLDATIITDGIDPLVVQFKDEIGAPQTLKLPLIRGA